MRHKKTGRKFGRTRDQRNAFIKGLCSSFFIRGHMMTTEARAKEIRPYVENAMTRAKTPDLQTRRLLIARFSPLTVKKIFERAAAMSGRAGGYTRIIKIGARPSDGARMARIEMVK